MICIYMVVCTYIHILRIYIYIHIYAYTNVCMYVCTHVVFVLRAYTPELRSG